jgi:hypothetical protein
VKRNTVILLAAGAAVMAGFAVMLVNRSERNDVRVAGQPLLPDLEPKAADVAALEVLRSNATVRLEHDEKGNWVVASSDRYPARAELVRALLVSLAGLRLEEPMTAKPAKYAELGLAWPDESGRTRFVRFLAADPGAKPVAEVVLGDERFSPDAVFARIPGDDRTWRTRGRVQVPADAMGWMDTSILALPADETQRTMLAGLTLSRPGAGTDPALARAWPHEVAPEEKDHWTPEQVTSAQTGLPSFLERLDFEGVRKARPDAAPDPAWSPSFELKGATVALNGRKDGDATWFTITVTPKPGAKDAPTRAKSPGDPYVPSWTDFAARTAGWEFKLPGWKAETLRRMRATPEPGRADLGIGAGLPPLQAPPPKRP